MPVPLAAVLSSIPSPPDNSIHLGPLNLRAYGLMIGLGVVAGIALARRRWRTVGGDPDDIYTICMWAVPAGLVGTRIYHVVTDNQLYRGHWFDNPFASGTQSPLALWNGGLGIPGGIIAGVAVGLWIVKRLGIRPSAALDMAAPCMPLAQAIGRYGNWFNQELFGGPTDLPWGLEIDVLHRPANYIDSPTFHPTFLYESLWNLGLVVVIVLITKKRWLRPGRLWAVYIGGYFLGRLWVEAMRSDPANTIGPFRVNIWISLVAIAGSIAVVLIWGPRRREGDDYTPYLDGHTFVADGVMADGADGADGADRADPDDGDDGDDLGGRDDSNTPSAGDVTSGAEDVVSGS